MSKKDPYRFPETKMPEKEKNFREVQEELIAENDDMSNVEKFMNFPVFTSRQSITRFLTRHELFKMVIDIPGEIFECGVLFGGGVFSFSHFSSIYEPVNAQRKIIGFDSFEGLPSIHEKDKSADQADKCFAGSMAIDSRPMLEKAASMHDMNRQLSHIPKVALIKGNVTESIPKYFDQNPHSLVSLLYLDMDIYEGTKSAIETCISRMPSGAIIAFDEFGCERWPGETLGLLDSLGVRGIKLRRFPFDSYVSYIVLD